MYEKCYEYNTELHKAFIDFNQAYNSINRSTVTKVLKEMQIPEKIVRLVSLVTQHTKAKTKLNNTYTEQIEVKTGIKQGDPLSIILFCTVMESLIKKIRDKRKYINAPETNLCFRGRCCVGDKNETGPNKYTAEAKTRGREIWIRNKPKQNKIQEALKNTNLCE
jgi:hypothetical protein